MHYSFQFTPPPPPPIPQETQQQKHTWTSLPPVESERFTVLDYLIYTKDGANTKQLVQMYRYFAFCPTKHSFQNYCSMLR